MRAFDSPARTLGDLDAEGAGRLLAAVADVALIVDDKGVIRDLAFSSDDFQGYEEWLGKPWVDTVTPDSRAKVDVLLKDSQSNVAPRWRHINHPSPTGSDLPMSYAAVALPRGRRTKAVGQAIAFGRDLRGNAALQQRLISAQQSMERDYWRLRHMETRYRSLFQMAAEAVLIVDASTGKLEEANPAATALFGADATRPGWLVGDGFDVAGRAAVLDLLARVKVSAAQESITARWSSVPGDLRVAASLFRQEKTTHILIRVAPVGAPAAAKGQDPQAQGAMLQLIEAAPDALVVTDLEGRILKANHAFVELAQLVTEAQVRGQSLERWLGRTGVDFNVLMSSLRQRGVVRLFATVIRGEYGATSDVEISGVSVTGGHPMCMGFTIRDVSRRLGVAAGGLREMPHSVGQMTELVGRVPLKDIVRDTTDLIEQLCIEAALELTHDNRASAAEMLGLSRQSLYVKLRRFNVGDLAAAPEGQ